MLPWHALSTMFDNENIMSIGTSTVVDQETMILILYLLRSTIVYHGQLRLNMRQWLTKVIKPYYNHVETW